jgi:hypothetical protein
LRKTKISISISAEAFKLLSWVGRKFGGKTEKYHGLLLCHRIKGRGERKVILFRPESFDLSKQGYQRGSI